MGASVTRRVRAAGEHQHWGATSGGALNKPLPVQPASWLLHFCLYPPPHTPPQPIHECVSTSGEEGHLD
jgi:hypothetical protein